MGLAMVIGKNVAVMLFQPGILHPPTAAWLSGLMADVELKDYLRFCVYVPAVGGIIIISFQPEECAVRIIVLALTVYLRICKKSGMPGFLMPKNLQPSSTNFNLDFIPHMFYNEAVPN